MSNTYQKILRYSAIAIGTIFAGIYSIPLNAQTTPTDNSSNLENIMLEDDFDWSFSSEDEAITVKDDIKELEDGEYSISEENPDRDLGLVEEDKKWGNTGDVESKSFEIEVYDY